MSVNAAAPSAAPGGEIRVLVVDDLALDRRMVGHVLKELDGWSLTFANNGLEAIAALARGLPHLVLTDLQMPLMNGLALVEQVREKYPEVPVVLMTRTGSEEIAVAALRCGAASYVPKRNLAADLVPTLQKVLTASRIDRQRQHVLSCLGQRDSRFVLESDPELIGPLVSLLQEELLAMGICDATGAIRAGIALGEALLNSLYHGNLELPPAARQEDETSFRQLVQERRQQDAYRSRRLRLFANVTPAEASYIIFNEGQGFDPWAVLGQADLSNLEKSSDRGALLIQTHMDQVIYNRTGRQVTLVKRREKKGR